METNDNIDVRRTYSLPKMDIIKMDNVVSLTLSSLDAPDDPEAYTMPSDWM